MDLHVLGSHVREELEDLLWFLQPPAELGNPSVALQNRRWERLWRPQGTLVENLLENLRHWKTVGANFAL